MNQGRMPDEQGAVGGLFDNAIDQKSPLADLPVLLVSQGLLCEKLLAVLFRRSPRAETTLPEKL